VSEPGADEVATLLPAVASEPSEAPPSTAAAVRPEAALGAAFIGGLVLARLLKRLAR